METDQQEFCILDILQQHLATAHKDLSKGNVSNGRIRSWSRRVRAYLRKIYGSTHIITSNIVPIPENTNPFEEFNKRAGRLEKFISNLEQAGENAFCHDEDLNPRVFIGHGRSPIWRELKDFLFDRLSLPWDEFNREAVAGYTTFERLSNMLDSAIFAFLVMTAEDQHFDETIHARQNVVHEVGLFQGRLGPKKAIILLEEGCQEFTNVVGLSQIRFPRGRISAVFEDIRRVLEREGIIRSG